MVNVDVYYYETTVKYEDGVGYMHLGWAHKMDDYEVNSTGEKDSILLHISNGRFYFNGQGTPYCGSKIKSGTIVGAFMSRKTGEVWFTINGKSCGIALQEDIVKTGMWYPTISSAVIGSFFEFHNPLDDDAAHTKISASVYQVKSDDHIMLDHKSSSETKS